MKHMKVSNDEKFLIYAIVKYQKIIDDNKDFLNKKELVLERLKRDFISSKGNKQRPLKKTEAIEMMKYFDRSDYISDIENMILPEFSITHQTILTHKIFDESLNKEITIEEYDPAKKKLRLGYIFKDLKEKWIESDFKLTNKQLLSMINMQTLMNYFKPNLKNKNNKK
jgi:hypothetical protein